MEWIIRISCDHCYQVWDVVTICDLKKSGMKIIQSIQNRSYEIRGERVMLDRDLANLYQVETKRLTEAVKRNSKRFPIDFMFQLTKEEWEHLRFQIEILEDSDSLRPQIATLKNPIRQETVA